MDYSKIVTRSFQVVRIHRALWLFGVLLALFGGSGGGGGGSVPSVPGGDGGPPIPPSLAPPRFNFETLVPIFIACGCALVLLLVVGLFLRFVSRAALVGLVNELEETQAKPTVGRGFRIGLARFWSLLGLAIIVNLPLALLAIAAFVFAFVPLVGTLAARGARGVDEIIALAGIGTVLLFICALVLVLLLALVIKPFYEFMVRVCVIQTRGAFDSVREGWRIVRANLGKVVMLYILTFAIGLGFGIVMIPIALILVGIPIAAGVVIYLALNTLAPAIILAALIGVPMLLVLIFVSGLYAAYDSTMWTEGYLQITKPRL